MSEFDLETLRSVVKRCMQLHQHGSSLYWADKAACLSKGAIRDIIALAEAMYYQGQYHRAIAVLTKHEKIREEIYSRFLIAQCYCKCNEYNEALKVLETLDYFNQNAEICTSKSFISFRRDDGSCNFFDNIDKSHEYGHFKATESDYHPDGVSSVMLNSGIALLKGKINEALNNLPAATNWYQTAFRLDPFCYEAFEKLAKLEAISSDDEKLLYKCEFPHASVNLNSLLRALYVEKIPKSDTSEATSDLVVFENNSDFLVNKAERLLSICHYRLCYSLTSRVLNDDPLHPDCLPIHISVLRMLNKSNDLFIIANQLLKIYPESAISWFATGSYYLSARRHDLAKRHLRKCTQQDRRFGPGWLALGHAYAADNEHDQAIAAYCTAAQIVRCSHTPLMYIGVEYSASNNNSLAERFLQYARQRSPDDPAILHELGSLAYKSKRYPEALELLKQAYTSARNLSDQVLAPYWEPLLNNMAHVYRELGQYDEALKFHYMALNLIENSPSTLEAMGLVYALKNNFEDAIRAFQTAISFQTCLNDTNFASKMLRLCLQQFTKDVANKSIKSSDFQPGRGIVDSPPPNAFPLLPLPSDADANLPSIKADLDIDFHALASKPNLDPSDLLASEDVSMDST